MSIKFSPEQLVDRTRQRCEDDFEFFVRYFFKVVKGSKFVFSEHHHTICNALMDVFHGRTTHLIINMPPPSGDGRCCICAANMYEFFRRIDCNASVLCFAGHNARSSGVPSSSNAGSTR